MKDIRGFSRCADVREVPGEIVVIRVPTRQSASSRLPASKGPQFAPKAARLRLLYFFSSFISQISRLSVKLMAIITCSCQVQSSYGVRPFGQTNRPFFVRAERKCMDSRNLTPIPCTMV